MTSSLWVIIVLFVGFPSAVAPPPNRQQAQTNEPQQDEAQKPLYQFAYAKYLEEVVKILESDPKFHERIKTMNEDDIKEGKIADHLDDLSPGVAEKLTKAKLQELERLREEINEDLKKHGDPSKIPVPEHIDVYNWESFHKEDLRKLIKKTVSQMEDLDKQRKEQFKEYEMKKKAEEDHKLAQMPPEQREEEKRKLEESQTRHKQHEKLKHPGDREQLEEVWEESDHMDKDSFDPRTFFALHDLNGDGYWNEEELEALFQIELTKIYNETDPDDDPKERVEEMYRMREHVVNQMDKNKDRLISLDEFMQDNEATLNDNKDEGWQDLADQKVYSDEELQKFEAEYAKQQGWGEHAYDPITAPPNLGSTIAPAQPHQQQQAQPNQQQPQVASNQVHQQPVGGAPKAVDPRYGV